MEGQESLKRIFEGPFEAYEVIGLLGEGGAGRVYAVKTESGERFALKCLSPERITNERRKRFKNEIHFCSNFKHRNLVQVQDVGVAIIKDTKCSFYVMPEYPMTLRKLMEKGIPKEKALPLFSQILDGIDAAHKFGVFHRDLKPENILYDPSRDLLVIADFGIAHFEEDIIATTVETKGTAKMANLGYSAPEQRIKGGKVNQRADIWALGLILNEIFTGSVPHGIGFKTVASVAPDFKYIDSLVEKMIQNEPGARLESIDLVKKELIARKNEFVVMQKLDEKKKAVIPKYEADEVNPVNLVDVDWDDEVLKLILDRAPEVGWVAAFSRPLENYCRRSVKTGH